MKNQFGIILRLTAITIALGALCFAGAVLAQESPAAKNTKSSGLTQADKTFIKKAARGGMMEVDMGKMAQEQSTNDDVKSFGKRMVTDHSKANSELEAIAKQKGVKMPGKKSEMKWKSDKEYIDMMVKDHEKDLAEFQKEASDGTDADLKKFAGDTAKVIEEHLNLAKETQTKVK